MGDNEERGWLSAAQRRLPTLFPPQQRPCNGTWKCTKGDDDACHGQGTNGNAPEQHTVAGAARQALHISTPGAHVACKGHPAVRVVGEQSLRPSKVFPHGKHPRWDAGEEARPAPPAAQRDGRDATAPGSMGSCGQHHTWAEEAEAPLMRQSAWSHRAQVEAYSSHLKSRCYGPSPSVAPTVLGPGEC